MRYLAIDLGDKRTGLALGDDITRVATPVDVLEVPIDLRGGEALLDALASGIDKQLGAAPGELILGLPINMDGSEGDRAGLCRAFAARLHAQTTRTVHLVDERRTSVRADELMARSGLTRGQKKARRDAIAAAAILDIFFEQGPIDPRPSEPQ